MKLSAILAAIFLVFAGLSLATDAEAARMGGGKSFGSRPSMSQPAPRPAERAATRPQATAPMSGAQQAGRSGMLGGMGGIMGGLLAGTLLGSLLGGGSSAGAAGAGGGMGFIDIILLGVLAFLGYKLYQRFKASRQAQADTGGRGLFDQQPLQRNDTPYNAPSQWGAPGSAAQAVTAPDVNVPAGFNTEEFLRGAKMAYNRLQQAWDKRDLNDIAQFVTPTVLRELQKQAAEDPGPSHTEIMTVNAELTGVEEEGANTRAQVYFDVLMREDPSQGAPSDVREIWHFLRIGPDGNWKLDGIQQVN